MRLSTRGADQRIGELAVGRTLVRARRRRCIIAVASRGRTRMEVLGRVNGCPISSTPHDAAVHRDQRPVGLTREDAAVRVR